MTTLNSRVTMARNLQELFRDGVTGEPLRNGFVYFYKDNARTTPKAVYKLSGSPPNYTYTALPNPVQLTGIGTFSDDEGNDIIPHYFPYQGTPSDTDGTIELYYIVVKDEDGVEQWTREGFPETTASGSDSAEDLVNYIPNGQFLFHNDIPANEAASPATIAGQITEAATILAQGGWSFNRSNIVTSTDFVTFEEIAVSSGVVNPTANPKYGARVRCTVSDGNTKDLRIKFDDVNKFASTTQEYTFYFEGISNSGGTLSTSVWLIKNYGSGGDPESEEQIGTAIFNTSYQKFSITFTFGTNIGSIIGSDDYLQLAIRFPSSSTFDTTSTNFMLTLGAPTISEYTPQTDADMKTRGISGWLNNPRPDGYDLYLPVRQTPAGMAPDYSGVGKIFACAYELNADNIARDVNESFCDKTGFLADGYDSNGIPYRRLHDKLWNSTAKITQWGGGAEYLDAYVSDLSPASEVRFVTNKPGSVTAIDAKTSGMTVKTVRTGMNLSLDGYKYGTALLYGIGTAVGATASSAAAGTSTFTVAQQTFPSTAYQVFSVQTVAAAALAGTYFAFGNTSTAYYLWFKVNGSGADPAPGGLTTAGFIDLNTNYTADDVSNCVREAINGGQISTIVALAGSAITPGTYFTIYSNSGAEKTFNVWFEVSGVGSAPAASGIPIKVEILTGDSAAQVADKIRIAVNMKFVGKPDGRNIFLRGYSSPSTWDYDSASRFTNKSVLAGTNIGTYELSGFTSHIHGASSSTTTTATNSLGVPDLGQFVTPGTGTKTAPGAGNDFDLHDINYTPTMTSSTTTTITATGGSETRSVNMFVNFVIKY
jgi:hypothetical protein